jgi:hypothetical protein
MVINVVSFILSFTILVKNVDFRVLPRGVLDRTIELAHSWGA